MDSHTIDILLSTYNGAPYLPTLLESLEKQTYSHIHVLARDDGSNDTTPELLCGYDCLPATENCGVQKSFSLLLKHSEAPYVMFADQDDLWLSGKVERTLKEMKRMEKIHGKEHPILVHTDLAVTDHSLKVLHPSFWAYSNLDPYGGKSLARMLTQNCVTGCTMMLNRALAEQVGEIPPNAPMHDHWIALIATLFGRVSAVPEATILYRQHASNDTGALHYSTKGVAQLLRAKATPNRWAENRRRRRVQAEELLKRYGGQLTTEQGKTIEAYLQFHKSGVLGRLQLMREFGFTRTGFLRSLKEIID